MSDDSAAPGPSSRSTGPRRFFFDDLADDPDAPPVNEPPVDQPPVDHSPVRGPQAAARESDPSARPDRSPRRLVFDDLADPTEPAGPADDSRNGDTLSASRPSGDRPGGDRPGGDRPGTGGSQRRLVGAAVGVIGVIVIAVVVVALLGRTGQPSRTTAADRPGHHAAPANTAPASPAGRRSAAKTAQRTTQGTAHKTATTAAAPPAPVRVPLTVLNNTTVTGLAHHAAQDFESHGWSVSQVSNYTGRLAQTTVFYRDAGQLHAARTLAAQFPGIAQVAPLPAGLSSSSGLTVVLAPDWSTS